MLNLAIFIKCPENKNADYNRQQVSERGILGFIDSFNESMMEKFDLNYDMMIHMYELLHNAEVSLQKNANDPRVKKALNDFTNNKVAAAIGNKEPEPEPEPEPAGEDKEDNGIAGEPGVSGDEALKKAETETLKEAEEMIEGKEEENQAPTQEPTPEPEPEPSPESPEHAPEPEPEKEDVKEEAETSSPEPAPEPEPEKETEAPAEEAAPKTKRTTKKKAE